MKNKPGVILLPVSAVFIIFIVLLVMLIDQKQSNNALLLEYKATRVINILLDLYINDQQIDPEDLDEAILGYGIYNRDRNALALYGSAPEVLPKTGNRSNEVILTRNKSIIIIRSAQGEMAAPPGAGAIMQRMPQAMQRRLQDMRNNRPEGQAMSLMLQKYQAGVYLEYSNSSYLSERNLILLIIFLFIIIFAAAFILVFRLYKTNRMLLLKNEHDNQLLQLGEAARTLAHEIRNPLGTLKIQRDLLFRKLPSEYDGNLQVIDRELKRLNVLVDKVGDFLRNPKGRPEKIELAAYTKELYDGRNDVKQEITVEKSNIFFDRDRLRTVLDNIVNNAVDSGGTAELSIDSEGSRLRLRVIDHGDGFSDEALRRVFDPFFTTKNNGTGLGLSVVKRLMESAGGRVEISNMKEGGASVVLVFGEGNESFNS